MAFSRLRVALATHLRALALRIQPTEQHGLQVADSPLRGELLSLNLLEAHARLCAAEQRTVVMVGWGNDPLRAALTRDERQIGLAQQLLGADLHRGTPISPAAEWLLDNAYVINEQIRAIRHDLPGGYYRELPKLRHGQLAGLPRAYAIALELITHSDGRLDAETLLRFLLAYQSVTPLRMGELWAIAIMLRIGLVKNLARLATLILNAREQRREADSWAERLLASGADERAELRALALRHPVLPVTFAAQLFRHLRAYDGQHDIGPLMTWLETQPVIPHESVEALVHEEHQRQAANQLSVSNSIASMRAISALNWPDWFERVSLVEQVLRREPGGDYVRSTFATRDRYRHAVEELARGAQLNEEEIARRVLSRVEQANPADLRARHIGYYLVDKGRSSFERELGYRPTPGIWLRDFARKHPTALYLGALAGTTTATLAGGLYMARRDQAAPAGGWLLGGLLGVLPAAALASELVNRAITQALPPRVLPRLDLSDGIPAECTTIVVVPTLLLTPESVTHQLERLEVLALANADPHLHFALLTDFADAPAPSMPEDAALLDAATHHLRRLAEQHGPERFLLLHRRRQWNERQQRWMGWERKRGKLEEFNALLAGAQTTTYTAMLGDLAVLGRVRYVITLDADTQLPRNVGQALIGTLAHPLNQAQIDPKTGRVCEGYGILQPRVGIDLPSSMTSRFARVFAGNVGIDPYTTAVSDAYMDLFGEGIFAGKGIYDPQALRSALHDRFPENALLSHDLIEGLYARVGLLSDVEVVDNYPTTYAAWAARQHRWVRGDWQVAPWLFAQTPSANGPRPNVLPVIARYKLFDNLRRSLTPPASVALLLASWRWLPGHSAAWSTLALAHGLAPLVFDLLGAALSMLRNPTDLAMLRSHGRELAISLLRFTLNTALLPDQSINNLDAIARTLSRLLFTHRNLLEWETAAQAQSRLQRSHTPVLRRTAPVLALAALLIRGRTSQPPAQRSWLAALPLLADWFVAPMLAAWCDRPYLPKMHRPSAEQERTLRQIARTTWAYFEHFVREEANFLAPDNFQETPRPVIADRTSPTNIGLQLLADLAAHDFGYLGFHELTARSERTLASVERLEHYRGHLLNWYDTQQLRALPPAYISTVDSGNFIGALITLRQGYLGLRTSPVISVQALAGLADTLLVLQQQLSEASETWQPTLTALQNALRSQPQRVNEYQALLHALIQRADSLPQSGPGSEWALRFTVQAQSLLDDLERLVPSAWMAAAPPTIEQLAHAGSKAASELLARHQQIAQHCAQQVAAHEFDFLYDQQRHLFAIGYNLADGRRDAAYYDLLASESRLGSFLAIASGEVPQEHWFHLGRTLTAVGLRSALLSWSGTMFEYLMPLIWMRRYPETLLDATYEAVVDGQIAYGKERGVPWGISESAFNARDLAMNYQYRAFGVPGLGLKAGLGDELVIAPYATVLALPVRPAEALANLTTLINDGMFGAYGLYEAVDYTPGRLPPGQRRAIIHSYMAHHQGMSLLTLANMLHNQVMQERFHAEPLVQATTPLLQERVPQGTPDQRRQTSAPQSQVRFAAPPVPRQFTTPHTAVPYTHLLSNGRYSVMLTNAGGSASSFDDLAVTRWRSDVTRDERGSYIYVRDTRSGMVWSTAYQPTGHASNGYQVIYGLDKAEFRQEVAGIETRMEVVVAAEEQAELRRVTLTNRTAAPRELELTSYAEVVLAPPAADEAHPAFANLFVETEYVPQHEVLLASRRPRAPTTPRLWAMHSLSMRGHALGATQFESDRNAFIGRGRDVSDPLALQGTLGGHSGVVLDPALSLRRRVRIVPGGSAQITFITGVAESREAALALADRLHDPAAVARAFDLAWTQSQVELSHLGIDADQAHRFQRLASAALYLDARRRARPETIIANSKGQPALWPYGISGDFPLVLVRVGENDELTLVGELLHAHEYWRLKRLLVDLVILNEDSGGYAQGRQEQILSMVRGGRGASLLNARAGIFVLRGDLVPEADRILLETVACTILTTHRGDLAQHLRRREPDQGQRPGLPKPSQSADTPPPALELLLPSPYGGFTPDGAEYVIDLAPGASTPVPWTNVIANPNAGFIVTEAGGGYSWVANSRENRLTPWSNDPVNDPPGEMLYLRDEASGMFWSPLRREQNAGHIRVRHGFGYTSFERQHGAIASLVTLSVPPEDPVKIIRLRLRNTGASTVRLSATIYVEWVLGVFRAQMAPYVVTAFDQATGVLTAQNAYNVEFGERVAFLASSGDQLSYSADRTDFLGRNGDLAAPLGLAVDQLSGRSGAGYDPCGALRCVLTLAPTEEHEVVFLLGQGTDAAEAHALAARYRDPAAAEQAQQASQARWRELLGAVQVQTPDPALDVLLNGWLLYQTLVCRIWGRSAFYQSGGAYGFRDQLQDVMALAATAPELAREQIVRAAARQFVAGDVQHWWHPPSGRGIRTNFSDDYLWLPYVVHHYSRVTGDSDILNVTLPFLNGRALATGEAEYYDLPTPTSEVGSLYEHCTRAIEYGLGRMGPHGLPLMGAGDWNDGMNLVGEGGTGESVWVGWFMISVLRSFAELAAARNDQARVERYLHEAERLNAALETHAWDGDWYLRAFYDDGTALGSQHSAECRIDSLTQSWAVISGAGATARAQQGMEEVQAQLVDHAAGLIRLFTPPFDTSEHNPGYIKGYVPGVRENGGQYTHAAIWAIWAWALLGKSERVHELVQLINPVRHSMEHPERYLVEPYVIAADVYTATGHVGRGGWTWYTGSAGWFYRLGLEQLLGLQRNGSNLRIKACLPASWPGYTATYRYGTTMYHIHVERSTASSAIWLDGTLIAGDLLPLNDDGAEHRVEIAVRG